MRIVTLTFYFLFGALLAWFAARNWDFVTLKLWGDYELAIEEGATVVRVGQAIFGARAIPDSHYWPEAGA